MKKKSLKGKRPSAHVRKVPTKKGKKKVLVNPRIKKIKKVRKKFKVMSMDEAAEKDLQRRLLADDVAERAEKELEQAEKLENSMSFFHSRDQLLDMAKHHKERGERLQEISDSLMDPDPRMMLRPGEKADNVIELKEDRKKKILKK